MSAALRAFPCPTGILPRRAERHDLRPSQALAPTSDSADVSEFHLRMLMQSSASPFVISNAVRNTWLSTGTHS